MFAVLFAVALAAVAAEEVCYNDAVAACSKSKGT